MVQTQVNQTLFPPSMFGKCLSIHEIRNSGQVNQVRWTVLDNSGVSMTFAVTLASSPVLILYPTVGEASEISSETLECFF